MPPLNSLRDKIYKAIWSMNEQKRIFETMIGVLSIGLQTDPKVAQKVEDLMNSYINLVMPGTEEKKRNEDTEFATRTAKALDDIAALLAGSNNATIKGGETDMGGSPDIANLGMVPHGL